MSHLVDLLKNNEDWLMERVLGYARERGYTMYTSTLKEAWRLSISGLSASITEAAETYDGVPELGPDEDFASDSVSRFGIIEARRHRERGVNLGMFLGLMKYYRQSYLDLVRSQAMEAESEARALLFVDRVFDRIEIGFCVEWSGGTEIRNVNELQAANRRMTNEKNKYLTIFESIPNPVILLNREDKVDNMNLAAAGLFQKDSVAGALYYQAEDDRPGQGGDDPEPDGRTLITGSFGGSDFYQLVPWLRDELDRFNRGELNSAEFEKRIDRDGWTAVFRVKLAKSLDVSGKFDGTVVILEDITTLKNVLDEVRTLRGFVPICSNCKNIRDDQGFWYKVEQYVEEHSEAKFSHGICPDCARKLYPEYCGDDQG